jgi:hypothetical protein
MSPDSANTGAWSRLASQSPATRCVLPGRVVPAHTASVPVSLAWPAAANAAPSSCLTPTHSNLLFSNRIRQRIKGIADQSKNMFDADLIEHADQELRNRLCPFVAPDPNLSPSQNRPARIGLRLSDHLLPM